MKTALIIVDIQNDFLPGGSLAVPDGNAVIPVVNRIQKDYDLIAATQDWHPRNHSSFASNQPGAEPFDRVEINGELQTVWPDHCVWGSEGAEFNEELDLNRVSAIFRKGMDPDVDSYSGFYDLKRARSTGIGDWLTGLGAEQVHIVGLAAEICVAFTANDAASSGFKTVIIENGTRALDEGDLSDMKDKLVKKGVEFVTA